MAITGVAEMFNPWVVKVGLLMLVFAGTGILRTPGLPPCEIRPNIEYVLFQLASAPLDASKVEGLKYFLNLFELVSAEGNDEIQEWSVSHQ